MKVSNVLWWTVLLPSAGIILVDYARHRVIIGYEHPWWEEAALLVGVLLVMFCTSHLLITRLVDAQRREREAETLRRISVEVTSTLDLKTILFSVLSHGRELLNADCLGIAAAGPHLQEAIVLPRGAAEPRRVPIARAPFLGRAVDSEDGADILRDVAENGGSLCHSRLCCRGIPLRMGPRPLGAMCIGMEPGSAAKIGKPKLAGHIAALACVAMANALLYREAQLVAVMAERERIAREMHDSMAQALAFISVAAASSRTLLRRRKVPQLDEQLVTIGQMADEAYLDVREAILGLRLSPLETHGLVQSLEEYLGKFSRQSGMAARILVEGDVPANLPPHVEIQLLRVVQEALTNVRKHAQAREVLMRLERIDGVVRVTVQDDGQGFRPSDRPSHPLGGYGLGTMRERLKEVGGELTISTAPGSGTAVIAAVPLSEEEASADAEG